MAPISIHAPRAGSDEVKIVHIVLIPIFQSTLPVRGATGTLNAPQQCQTHFNPRSPCGERRGSGAANYEIADIFQSTLPVRGATGKNVGYIEGVLISIHAPRAGSDVSHAVKVKPNIRFQSTLPVRGATPCAYVRVRMVSHFNPRSPCGERPSRPVAMPLSSATFQSTLPVRGATELGLSYSAAASGISIHAPRAGSDS